MFGKFLNIWILLDKILGELAGKDTWQQIEALEQKMFEAAKDLEFELAARLRDQINQLKAQG